MSAILALFNFIRHIDKELVHMTQNMGPMLYVALFAIVFAETGLVVTPFLPGDSLLFAIGVLCAMDPARLNLPADGFMPSLPIVMVVLFVAAVLGDGVNYHIGKALGPKVFSSEKSRLLNKKHLLKTQAFYEKYGAFSIVMGRFVPIVRTFVPFLAGVAQMPYRTFFVYNVIGGVAWITSLVYAGYLFGNIPVVRDNLSLIVIAIVLVSVLPVAIKVFQEWRSARK